MANYNQKPRNSNKKEYASEGPINLEAERIVLASMLADNSIYEKYGDVLNGGSFSDALHGQIFNAIAFTVSRGRKAEPASVFSQLTENAPLSDMSAKEYLDNLRYNARPSNQIEVFIEAVQNACTGRKIVSLCDKYKSVASTGSAGVVDAMSADLGVIAGGNQPETYGFVSNEIDSVLQGIMQKRAQGGRITGISTGFKYLDEMINGLEKQRLYIVGARPKQGKTGFALCMQRNLLKSGIPVAFFSLELPKKEVVERLIAIEAGVNFVDMVRGKLNESQMDSIIDASQTVREWPLIIDDAAGLSIEALSIRARQAVKNDNAKVIFIDYLQRMTSSTGKSEYERITDISMKTANLRKTLDVPIVALAQLNRKLVDRATVTDFSKFRPEVSRPNDSDLRSSGQIEQDADVLMFLNRPEVYLDAIKPQDNSIDKLIDWESEKSKYRGKAEVIVHFNRSGPTGISNMRFDGPTMSFNE